MSRVCKQSAEAFVNTDVLVTTLEYYSHKNWRFLHRSISLSRARIARDPKRFRVVAKRLYCVKSAKDQQQHSARTRITSMLWHDRQSLTQEQETNIAPEDIGTQDPTHLIKKSPADSLKEIWLPFSTDQELREQYLNVYKELNFGRILEDMDAMAGNVAHMHADDANPVTRPLTIVTASLARIDLLNKLLPDRDLKLSGRVIYVGRSSMEIQVSLDAVPEGQKDGLETLVNAYFTMVATYDGKAAPVNHLVPSCEEEQQLFNTGKENKKARKEESKKSLSFAPPTEDERLIIHNLFLEVTGRKLMPNSVRSDVNTISMASTTLDSVLQCQLQERNTNNKVFGGYLMKQAFNLAWTNAHVFSASQPRFLALDEVIFHRPVSIGDIVFFTSQVVYTHGPTIGIEVVAEVMNYKTHTKVKSNTFHFLFTCPDAIVNRVVPVTYEESMKYLLGRRKHEASKKAATSLQSALMRFYD